MKNIAIIGAGGHTKSSINLLKQYFKNGSFKIYDDNYKTNKNETIHGVELVGTCKKITKNEMIFLSIGDNQKREKQFMIYNNQLIVENLIHSTAYLEEGIYMGISNQIYANTYINAYVKIGDNNIINTSAILEHEVNLGSHNHISIGVRLCGRVKIADRCFVGAGAIVIDKVSICSDVIIGAGAVIIKDITQSGTYVGNPARKIK